MSKKKEKIRIHYVASTHWDREWYLPFQGFRFKLVKLVDKLLKILDESLEYEYFVFDGQTIALEDYLEIRPENREKLEKYVNEGRIVTGPWYTMPDERILSGESLIRNLLKGHQVAEKFQSTAMKYGYICDIFGHIAQMPQIFRGFGIKHALLGRGTNETTHPANLIWQSPDGSEVITFKLPDVAGYGIGRKLYSAAESDTEAEDWEEKIIAEGQALLEQEKKRTKLPVHLWLDGLDHQEPSENISQALKIIQKAMPETEIIFSTLPKFAEDIEKYADKLPVFKGEIIKTAQLPGGYNYLISHCQSSHYPMKQLNDYCQTLLEKWAEPLLSITRISGQPKETKNFTDLAWEYLLKNHPHDSICGCSIDQVHKDTEYRYDQCRLLAENVIKDSLEQILPGDKSEDKEIITLSVFNPLPRKSKQVLTTEIYWTEGKTLGRRLNFSGDRVPCFKLKDENGKEIPYQLHDYKVPGRMYEYSNHSPYDFYREDKVRISLETESDGIGTRRYTLEESPDPVQHLGTLSTGSLKAENEHLELEINPDGTFNLKDKKSGEVYRDLLNFEDTGEMGDGWFHVSPVNNQRFYSAGGHADISVKEDGPLMIKYLIEKSLILPESMDWHSNKRSGVRKEAKVTAELTLCKGSKFLSCKVKIDNNIKDHRLRALFPTEVTGENYFAAQPFAFVERKRGIDPATHNWKELDVEERSFCGIAGVSDGKRGMAILAGHGLHEIAVKDDQDGTMALTLFRSFKKTVGTSGEIRGQLLQEMDFSFSLMPFSGKTDYHELENLSSELNTGLRGICGKGLSNDKKHQPFISFKKGTIHLSTLKPAEKAPGVIMRIYNPTEKASSDKICFDRKFKLVKETDMEENEIGKIPVGKSKNTLEISLEPFKIKTLYFEF